MSRFLINGPSWLVPFLAYGGPSYMQACRYAPTSSKVVAEYWDTSHHEH